MKDDSLMKKIVPFILLISCSGIFALPVVPVRATLLDDIKAQIKAQEDRITQLEAQEKQFQGTIAQKQAAAKTLKNAIATLNAQIAELNNQLKITGAQINKTELNISSLNLQITALEEDIATGKIRIRETFRAMQAAGDPMLLLLMLQKLAFSSFFAKLAYADTLQESLFANNQVLAAKERDLRAQQDALAAQMDELTDLKNRLNAQSKTKSSQQTQKNTVLAQTKNDEKKYQQMLISTEKNRQDILRNIKELEDKLRQTIDPASMPAPRPGVLDWPAEGRVSQGYGSTSDTGFINDAYEFHNGVDIAAKTGTPIRAARSGIIKAIGTNGQYAYGQWIAVEHDNNLTTLYGHLSAYGPFKQGNAVKKGDIIGYVGMTGYATGPHVHFGVYASNTFITQPRWFGLLPLGGTVNPKNYLP